GLEQHVGNASIPGMRPAEFTAREIAETFQVLHRQGLVVSPAMHLLRVQRGGVGGIVEAGGERIAGREVHEREGERRDERDDCESLRAAREEKTAHSLRSLCGRGVARRALAPSRVGGSYSQIAGASSTMI